jgi:hypothetical protein
VRKVLGALSYSNVMATIAVFIALGGSAYALTRGEVESKHIARDAVKAKHIDFGVRSQVMLATFNALQPGTGSHNYGPSGTSGYGTGLVSEALAPQAFVATGLRINLDGPLASGSREFVFRYWDGTDHDTDLRCEIGPGQQECSSNARVRVPAGSTVWFRVLQSGTTEIDYAEVGWRAVLP